MIPLKHNRPLYMYHANSRNTAILQAAPTDVQGLFQRLETSQVIQYDIAAYRVLKKPQQDDLKDVGGYILGDLKEGRRRSGYILTRSAAVLDADNLPTGSTQEFIMRVSLLGYSCCIHSSAKHSPDTPRLRVVFPFAEDIAADMYAPVIRLLCRLIQPEMTWFDPTCDQAGRIMFYPAHCRDVEPIFYANDGSGLLDAAALLNRRLPNWRDPSTWPWFPRETDPGKLAVRSAKQQDPTVKTGLVGAFCNTYDILSAMDKFLPGVYSETTTPGRFTYTGGSTYGGAVVYEDGKYLYSHHATDPCGGMLVNAWDMVRLHLYGTLDDQAKPGTRGHSLPSYTAMCELAQEDAEVKARYAQVEFAGVFAENPPQDEEAAQKLAGHSGEIISVDIVRLALKALGIRVRRNMITQIAEISGMPLQYSKENAINTLPVILMDFLRKFKIKGVSKNNVYDYLANIIDENRCNPVLEMLHNTQWDGISRIPELVRILGIPADSFQALLVHKWLVQCIAMAHNTEGGVEAAEGVLTLQGAQGIGKTTLFRKLAVDQEWLAEGLSLDMRNKDDLLRATSVWIAELGELDSTLKREQTSLKAFITQKVDRIRAPYAREPTTTPRHTSFGATVNKSEFLKDETGDRRFWVVPVSDIDLDTLIGLDETWFRQLWAEVYLLWQATPQGFRLTPVERATLEGLNRAYWEPIKGEEEVRGLLDYDLPLEQWGQFTPWQVCRLLRFAGIQLSAQAVGRVLAKLAKEDETIAYTKNSRSQVKTYTLPIKTGFTDIAELNS